MELIRVFPREIEVGMTLAVSEHITHGWGESTGLMRYRIFKVTRVTPQRTKVVSGDEAFDTRKTIFYLPDDEMLSENRRVEMYARVCKFFSEMRKLSPVDFVSNLEQMERTVELIDELIDRRGERK